MATPLELTERGSLLKLDPGLGRREQELRLLYASPRLAKWFGSDLLNLGSSWNIELSPAEQLDAFIEVYASGKTLTFQRAFHPIRHVGAGVWMLKTADVRLFGWFWKRDVFIGHCADTAERVKLSDLYHGYAGDVVRFREKLDLNEPKFVLGDDPNVVVSNFDYP